MNVTITQRCGHRRILDVPEDPDAQNYLVNKWSNMICERCLWARIAPGVPFPEVPPEIDVRPKEDQ